MELAPGQRAVVPTGVAIALPDGYAAFVHPRSGLAARHGVTIVNAPGTVDAGYRGEIRVTLLNTDADSPVRFQRGDRIAQLVVQRVERPVFHEVEQAAGVGERRRRVRVDRRPRRGGVSADEFPQDISAGQSFRKEVRSVRGVPTAPPRGRGPARI